MNPPIILSWEYSDGSCGSCECASYELAVDAAHQIGGEARTWVGDEMVQRGFVASDEHSDE